MRSLIVGIPSGRRLPFALGIYTLLAGFALHVLMVDSSDAISHRSWWVRAIFPSIPAVRFPRKTWVTLLTDRSRLAWLLSISFVRLLTRFHFCSFVARNIRRLRFFTFFLADFQSISVHCLGALVPISCWNLSFTSVFKIPLLCFYSDETRWKSAIFRCRTNFESLSLELLRAFAFFIILYPLCIRLPYGWLTPVFDLLLENP